MLGVTKNESFLLINVARLKDLFWGELISMGTLVEYSDWMIRCMATRRGAFNTVIEC